MKVHPHLLTKSLITSILFLVVLTCAVIIFSPATMASRQGNIDEQPKRVLILNSYHPGMPLSDEEIRGIKTTLPADTAIFIEYMDTKRLRDAGYLSLLREVYAMKYAGKRFDLIFSLDDDALLFLLEHGQSIFKDIPVVFCGVNGLKPGMLDQAPLFTGVVETMHVERTLKTGLKLYPQAERILVVTDRSTTGASNRAILEEMALSGRIGRPFVFLDEGHGLDLTELIDKLRSSPRPSLVYHSDFFQDKYGHALNPESVMPLVSENAPGPVLVHGGMYLGLGALGGWINSGFYQGSTAAGLALRIWAGEAPSSIAVVGENVNSVTLDYQVMKRWGIDPAAVKISEQVNFINEPETQWHGYGLYLIAAVAFIILEGLLILWLLHLLRQQRILRNQTLQSEARFRGLFDLTPIPLCYTLNDGRFVAVNQAFTEVLGYTVEDLPAIDDWWLKAYPDPHYRSLVLESWQRSGFMNSDGIPKAHERRVAAKDGTEHVMLIYYNFLDNYSIASMVDITEHKKMQEMMVQTEKMISVGGISAGIAHEINNPLGIILQAVQTLAQRMRPDFSKNREVAKSMGLDLELLEKYSRARKLNMFIADIESAALRAASIIRHMLDFSRMSQSHRLSCSMPVIIDKALALASNDFDLKKSFDFKKISIIKHYIDPLPDIECTETDIEQVVLNLLRNSAQAMGADCEAPRIEIHLSCQGDWLRLEIRDNGPGIPVDIQRRIFEPFFTTKAPGVGTGLGLSVSYFIITNGHGGKMSVQSTPGNGTVFVIELPVRSNPEG
ncbi:PAS domain S-box-containing protein [Desulfomicrobium norvegicum]|uniref:histidine kinase n=1 Tax=Desulfomicrobium norvegicum (strain DSM 1741 / NCIMB 8310) TaxID=52561 RepID=A0A8G2C3U5_DESNO|nr:ATP-binding protein [Desulfomicrobium norvegicum]SFL86349.1 PAS domain S-box-containing protein [Desulfomicrobium norvegicum]